MTRRPRRSWTEDQRATIVADLQRRMLRGQSLAAASRELGIHQSTLRQWLRPPRGTSMQPVELEDDHARLGPEARPATENKPSISLATPDGFLFDGLDLASALRVWEHLR
jgi:transposase-like protein